MAQEKVVAGQALENWCVVVFIVCLKLGRSEACFPVGNDEALDWHGGDSVGYEGSGRISTALYGV